MTDWLTFLYVYVNIVVIIQSNMIPMTVVDLEILLLFQMG